MASCSGLLSVGWELFEKRELVLVSRFLFTSSKAVGKIESKVRWSIMPSITTYEPPTKERRRVERTLADELDYSADQLLHLRDRVSLVALIKALLHAFRAGEQEVRMTRVDL